MANELEQFVRVTLLNPRTPSSTLAQLKEEFEFGPALFTQTTQASFGDTVTVTTSEQDISIPTNSKFTAALQGVFCAVNLDSTNFVKIGPKSGGSMVELGRLYPRYPCVLPIAPSVTLRWVADTASCAVKFLWLAK